MVRRQNRLGLAPAEQVVILAHAFAGHELFFLLHGRKGIQGQALGAAENIFHVFGGTGIRAGVVQQAGHDRVRADDEALAVFDAVAAVPAHGFMGQGEKDAVGADVLKIEVPVLKGDQRVLAGNFTRSVRQNPFAFLRTADIAPGLAENVRNGKIGRKFLPADDLKHNIHRALRNERVAAAEDVRLPYCGAGPVFSAWKPACCAADAVPWRPRPHCRSNAPEPA